MLASTPAWAILPLPGCSSLALTAASADGPFFAPIAPARIPATSPTSAEVPGPAPSAFAPASPLRCPAIPSPAPAIVGQRGGETGRAHGRTPVTGPDLGC